LKRGASSSLSYGEKIRNKKLIFGFAICVLTIQIIADLRFLPLIDPLHYFVKNHNEITVSKRRRAHTVKKEKISALCL
jgi:hypothetical protein